MKFMKKLALVLALALPAAWVASPEAWAKGRSGSSRSSGGYYKGPRQPSGSYKGGMGGSSHRGGSYSNSNTGNHYQKRK